MCTNVINGISKEVIYGFISDSLNKPQNIIIMENVNNCWMNSSQIAREREREREQEKTTSWGCRKWKYRKVNIYISSMCDQLNVRLLLCARNIKACSVWTSIYVVYAFTHIASRYTLLAVLHFELVWQCGCRRKSKCYMARDHWSPSTTHYRNAFTQYSMHSMCVWNCSHASYSRFRHCTAE